MRTKQENRQHTVQTSCIQCGICCTKGGAALHTEDLLLLQEDKIPRKNCITLRKGEFAWNPVNEKIEAIASDIIKLRGTGGEWVCCYFDDVTKTCGIYANRPVACRTLKCWEPKETLALIGKNLLSRESILKGDDSLLELVEQYESEILLPDFASLPSKLNLNPKEIIRELENLLNRDLSFRNMCIQHSTQISEEELFLFGRPLFQLLQAFGLAVYQKENRLCLRMS